VNGGGAWWEGLHRGTFYFRLRVEFGKMSLRPLAYAVEKHCPDVACLLLHSFPLSNIISLSCLVFDWRFGAVVTSFVAAMKLLYVEPGEYWDG